MGTTCNDECGNPMYQSLCPDGSSGNGGGNNDAEYEFEAAKTVTWTVSWAPDSSGQIISIERIKGKRVSTEPQGGHFTSISHYWADCNFCSSAHPYDVWIEESHEVSASDQQANASVSGTLHYQGFVYHPSGSKQWSFSQVFP
jgi:hypothetical protein